MKKLVKQFLFVITWLLLIYTGFELGVWQLNKAQNLSASTAPVAEQPVIELSKIASAGLNIPIKAINRIVSASGIYSNKYIARDQKLVDEKIVDLDVRLLDLDTGYSILVVRGKANEPLPEIKSKTQIVGRLYPRQNVDRAFPKPGDSLLFQSFYTHWHIDLLAGTHSPITQLHLLVLFMQFHQWF